MSDDAAATPRPKLRAASDQRPAARADDAAPAAPAVRSVPVRAVLLVGLAVLLLLAVLRPGGVTAVVGVPLAVTLPGAVLQPRFLPGLHTDPVTRWFLRVALSLAAWALVGLGVGAAGVPLRSVWPVVVAVVLLAAVVLGEPDRGRRYGSVPVRDAGWGVVVVVAATLLAVGARGLVAVGGGDGGGDGSVVLTFADVTVPLSIAPTGASASARVVVTNTGPDSVTLEVGGQAGRALPWATVAVDVPAGATRTVTVEGGLPVCSDPQQVVVTVQGAGEVAPLSTVVPGAAGGVSCGSS